MRTKLAVFLIISFSKFSFNNKQLMRKIGNLCYYVKIVKRIDAITRVGKINFTRDIITFGIFALLLRLTCSRIFFLSMNQVTITINTTAEIDNP